MFCPDVFMATVSLAQADAPFVLVIDLGTSSVRALLYDARARAVENFGARRSYQADALYVGQSVFDARKMFDAFCAVLDELVAKIDFDVAAVAASSLAYNVL